MNIQYQEGIDSRLFIDLEWHIINMCNQNCGYCNIQQFNNPLWGKLGKNQFKYIQSFKNTLLPIRISFLGGEPTLHPKFNELVDEVQTALFINNKHSSLNKLTIFTNCSDSSVQKILKITNKNILIIPSYHPTEISSSNFCKNVKILYNANFTIEPHIMLIQSKKDKIIKIIERLKDIDSNIIIHGRVIRYQNTGYQDINNLEETYGKIFPEVFVINNQRLNSSKIYELINLSKFKNWNCYNNLYQLDITNQLTRECSDIRIDFNNEQNFNYFQNLEIYPIRCKYESCTQECLLSTLKIKE